MMMLWPVRVIGPERGRVFHKAPIDPAHNDPQGMRLDSRSTGEAGVVQKLGAWERGLR